MSILWAILNPLIQVAVMFGLPILLIFLFFTLQSFWEAIHTRFPGNR